MTYRTKVYLERTFNDKADLMTVGCHYRDDEKGHVANYALACSKHGRRRFQQRGFSAKYLAPALDHAKVFCRQGMEFYVVPGKRELKGLDPQYVEKVRNSVIVLSSRTGEVITFYKNENGMRHVKKKGKELKKYAA